MENQPQPMPWGAWGEPRPLPGDVRALLGQFLGLPAEPAPAVPAEQVALAPSRLSEAALADLRAAAGPAAVQAGRAMRLRHLGGKSTPDLLRRRAGDAAVAPDAVLLPGSHESVLALLAVAERHRLAVVPFGGGTSVTGGVEAVDGGLDGVVALDLARMDRLLAGDPVGRAGVGRVRPVQRHGGGAAGRDAPRHAHRRARPRFGRRARPPPAAARVGGHARSDHRGDRVD